MAEQQEGVNLLAKVFEEPIQKHASITYDFGNLELQGKIQKEGKVIPTCTVSLTMMIITVKG